LLPAVSWASTPQLADPAYLDRPLRNQAEPPRLDLEAILSPTPAVPALLTWQESFAILVRLAPAMTVAGVGDWRVSLTTRARGPYGDWVGSPVGMRFALPVSQVGSPSAGRAKIVARIPASVPRDIYHLEVSGPAGLRSRRLYAVRVLGAQAQSQRFRFVVIADHQLRDPSVSFSSADRNNESYPRLSDDDAESMFHQQVGEIAFLDPDFVLNLGDMMFGIDYRQEYRDTLRAWWRGAMATYMVPGNHDALALYELALKDKWWQEAIKSVRCARHLIDGEISAAAVFKALVCLFGDLKKMLFEDLNQDGLDYWHRVLGPSDYSFDLGGFHFVGLNSYAGTAERRHAFVLGLGFLGIDLGGATVDNYGGTLLPAQLAWLRKDLAAARAAGKKVILFLHHDPRGAAGESWGRRYHANLPFPTEPLGLRKFQEWNYDSAEWDSDPADQVAGELQTDNSAVRLLKLIAGHVDTVFCGHLHQDQDTVIEVGRELVSGSNIRAAQRIRFVRVTTASASPLADEGYWGYRLVQVQKDVMQDPRYLPKQAMSSLPAGNLWVVGSGLPASKLIKKVGGDLLFVIHSSLPLPTTGLLRAYLPDAPEGYRFPSSSGEVRLVDVGRAETGRNVYYLQVKVPALAGAKFPPPPGGEQKLGIEVHRAKGNLAPEALFQWAEEHPQPSQQVHFDGSPSRDPEGKALVQSIWDFGDGYTARGAKVAHAYAQPGNYPVSLTVIDDCGAFARYATRITVALAPACSLGSGACAASSATLVFVGLVLLGLRFWRRKRKSEM